MKRCPKCDFPFADFHRICHFDGTALLDDPERPPSFVNDRSLWTRFRRALKSTLFVDALAIAALLASALLIYYCHSPRESKSTATLQSAQNAFASPVAPAQVRTTRSSDAEQDDSNWPPAQRPAQTKAPATSARAAVQSNSKRTEKSASLGRREATASLQAARFNSPGSAGNQPRESPAARLQFARLNSGGSAGNQPRESTVALQAEREEIANRKQPKLLAMLKTTWRVLKKPFKF